MQGRRGHTDSGSNLAAERLHFLGEFRCVNLRAKDASGPGPTGPRPRTGPWRSAPSPPPAFGPREVTTPPKGSG